MGKLPFIANYLSRTIYRELFVLRYFNFESRLKLRWCRARVLFGLQIPVTTDHKAYSLVG